jgi:hypothetical protein
LCRHFWSAKQKLTFGEAEHKKRMSLSEPILKHLADVADFKMTDNVEKNTLIDILNKVILAREQREFFFLIKSLNYFR